MEVYQVSKTELQELITESVSLALEGQAKTRHREQVNGHSNLENPDIERLNTIPDICHRFDVTRQTVYEWRKKGLLKPIRIGNLIRFKESDIQQFLKFYNPSY